MIHPQMQGVVWMVYALPLTPLQNMDEAWQLLRTEVDSTTDIDLKAWLDKFLDYVRVTWFGRYKPADWTHATSVSFEHITNNAAGILISLLFVRFGCRFSLVLY